MCLGRILAAHQGVYFYCNVVQFLLGYGRYCFSFVHFVNCFFFLCHLCAWIIFIFAVYLRRHDNQLLNLLNKLEEEKKVQEKVCQHTVCMDDGCTLNISVSKKLNKFHAVCDKSKLNSFFSSLAILVHYLHVQPDDFVTEGSVISVTKLFPCMQVYIQIN